MSELTKQDAKNSKERSLAEVIAKSDERFAATEGRFLVMDEPFAIRQREIDENITRLSAAQLVTEEKFQALLDVLRRRESGHNRLS